MDILDAIGNTSLVRLRKVVPPNCADIRTTKKLILDMVEAARAMSEEPRTYWSDQLNNRDAIAGYLERTSSPPSRSPSGWGRAPR